MAKREQAETFLARFLLGLVVLTLFSFWLLGNLYAKYATQAEGGDSARVASFQVEDSNDLEETYVLEPALTAAESSVINVTVKNSSEVAVRYTFSFETDGNFPLVITGDGPNLQADAEESQTWIADKTAGSTWDEAYTFTLSLKDEEDNYQYAGGVESIQLTVTAAQID